MAELNAIIDFDYSAYFQAGFSLLSATNDMTGSVFASADSRKAFDRVGNAIQREACMKYGRPVRHTLHREAACCGALPADRLRRGKEGIARDAKENWHPARAGAIDRPASTCRSASPSGMRACSRRPRPEPHLWAGLRRLAGKLSVRKHQDVLRTRRRRSDGGEAGFLTHLLQRDLLLKLCRSN
jgi:hypothetical protein